MGLLQLAALLRHPPLQFAVPLLALPQQTLPLLAQRPIVQLDFTDAQDGLQAIDETLIVEGLEDIVGSAGLHQLNGMN